MQVTRSRRPGFTLVELLVVIAIIGMLVAMMLPAVQAAREAARRMQCTNNLRQIGLALHNYESTHGRLPLGWNGHVDPHVGTNYRWSYLANILPFIEQANVLAQLDTRITLYAPGGGNPPRPEHVETIMTLIPVFLCPSDRFDYVSGPSGIIDSAPTNYVACVGSGVNAAGGEAAAGESDERADGMFSSVRWRRLAECTDGLSNTVFCSESILGPGGPDPSSAEAPDPQTHMALVVPFMSVTIANCDQERPGGINRFPASRGRVWAGQGYENTIYNHFFPPNSDRYDCYFWVNRGFKAARSRHPGGVNVLMGDGAVRFVGDSVDLDTWRALATRSGGEVLGQF